MINIAETPFYRLSFSRPKNRAYLSIIGYWSDAEKVTDYMPHLQQLVEVAKPGFTLIVNAKQMLLHPPQIQRLHVKVQKFLIENGILASAEIFSNDLQADIQLDNIARISGINSCKFMNPDEAEDWLNHQVNAKNNTFHNSQISLK